ncbi:MAG: GDSL-type esterase/lipase family protein [Verrucomicrobiota bacterium]
MKFTTGRLLVVLLLCSFITRVLGAGAPHDFARWEKDISAYEQAAKTNPPPAGAALFVGSSTILRWKTLAEDFAGHRVINRGFGGSEIEDATHFAERLVIPAAPRVVFLRSGGNDLHNGKSAERVFDDYKAFVQKVQAHLPDTEIIFIGLSPSIARWDQHDREQELNRLIAEHVKRSPKLKYIECYDSVLGADGKPRPELFVADKLHFSLEGYKLLVERVRPFLPKD